MFFTRRETRTHHIQKNESFRSFCVYQFRHPRFILFQILIIFLSHYFSISPHLYFSASPCTTPKEVVQGWMDGSRCQHPKHLLLALPRSGSASGRNTSPKDPAPLSAIVLRSTAIAESEGLRVPHHFSGTRSPKDQRSTKVVRNVVQVRRTSGVRRLAEKWSNALQCRGPGSTIRLQLLFWVQ